jgi:hypothetical protein
MPLYLYQVIDADGTEGEIFEVLQPMRDAALTVHPETGAKVVRVFGTPNAPRTWTDSHAKGATSDKSLERGGFTKYVKSETGKYEKVFGAGPAKINRSASD